MTYGASRYALANGNIDSARVLWPLIEWCLEYSKRKLNPEGVVTSDKDELDEIITLLKEVASYENPFYLSFDGVSNYSNGAVFLKPDKATKVPLTELMIRIQKNTNIKNSYKSKDPHISIGRKLSAENVQIALKMFAEVKLDFECENLVLRKFDPVKKQYGIYSEDFKFLGELPKPDAQQSLF